jgi:hypothetical protein
MALKLLTPPGRFTDPFYHELLGIAIGAWMTSDDPNSARSDCTSAIRRFRQASNPTGHLLRYEPILQGIRARFLYLSHSLEWTKSHPERKKPVDAWPPADVGIHMADLVAGDPLILAEQQPTLT